MGLTQEAIILELNSLPEHPTLVETEQSLKVYDDVLGYVVGEKRVISPGETFWLSIPFQKDSQMLAGKTSQETEDFLQSVASGDLSLRSNMAITGITHTLQSPTLSRDEQGNWELTIELASDSTRTVTLPDEFRVGKPFERPAYSLEGKELVLAAAHLCKDELDHVSFVTKGGHVVGFETLLKSNALEDPESEYYPLSVFLPYTEEVGVIVPGEPLDLHTMPSRRNGFVKEYVNWEGYLFSDARRNPAVILKRTRGNIAVPDGYVGVINEQGLQGEIPHSRSTVLSSGYEWPIIGEHPLRTAGNNIKNPTGFVMRMYKAA